MLGYGTLFGAPHVWWRIGEYQVAFTAQLLESVPILREGAEGLRLMQKTACAFSNLFNLSWLCAFGHGITIGDSHSATNDPSWSDAQGRADVSEDPTVQASDAGNGLFHAYIGRFFGGAMKFSSLVCTTLVLSACVNSGLTPVASRSAFLPNGYLCSSTPSTAFSPGFVYRLDSAGERLLVADLSSEAVTYIYRAALGTYDAALTSSGGLEFALGPRATVAARSEISAGSSSKSKLTFRNGRFALMTDSDEEQLVESLLGRISERPGSRYFLVRDAIQATGMDIQLSSGDETTLGGELGIEKVVTLTPNAEIKRTGSANVSADFDEVLNVCVRAVEITIPTAAPGEPAPIIEPNGASRIRYLSADSLSKLIEGTQR